MPQGLEVFNENGTNTLSLTDRSSRVIGSQLVMTHTSGSIYVGNDGTPWYYLLPENIDPYDGIRILQFPLFEIAAPYINWRWPSGNPGTEGIPKNVTIIYGVF